MFNGGGVTRPLLADMLNKFAVPGFEGITAFGPIEHELGHGIGDKLRIDAGAGQNLTGVVIGLPVVGDRACFFLRRAKGGAFRMGIGRARCRVVFWPRAAAVEIALIERALQRALIFQCVILLIHPLGFYMAEEARIPVVAVGALFLTGKHKGIQL